MNAALLAKALQSDGVSALAATWTAWLNKEGSCRPCPGYLLARSEEFYEFEGDEIFESHGALYPDFCIPGDGMHHPEDQELLIEFQHGTNEPSDLETYLNGLSSVDERPCVYPHLARAVASQHRTAIFVFLVNSAKMRVVRWDRSGAIYTDAFDYTTPIGLEVLRDLLWAFAHLSPAQRGHDPTARRLCSSDPDFRLMSDIADCTSETHRHDLPDEAGAVVDGSGVGELPVFRFQRRLFAQSFANKSPRFSLQVPINGGPKCAEFLVGNATVCAPGAMGRGTRGFVAWDKQARRFVWLKDVWCASREGGQLEGDILRRLNGDGVGNVPALVCDGLLGQETLVLHNFFVPSAVDESNLDAPAKNTRACLKSRQQRAQQLLRLVARRRSESDIAPLKHYRIVVEEVCMQLSAFKNGKELFSIIREAVQGHADATRLSQLLHSEISPGNILIFPVVERLQDGSSRVVRKGFLADWELALPLTSEGMTGPRPVTQTGAWQFASVFIIDNAGKPAQVADDIEAFFNVVFYEVLRFLPHNSPNVKAFVRSYFDSPNGFTKRTVIFSGELPLKDVTQRYLWFDGNGGFEHPINDFFMEVLWWFCGRYIIRSVDSGREIKGSMRNFLSTELFEKFLRTSATKLRDHTAFLAHLDELLALDSWPDNDKINDQLYGAKAPDAFVKLVRSVPVR